jgi:6-phosphogluconate dehydrogenase
MELGIVGMGRMGSNMARRLLRRGHQITVYDLNRASAEPLEKEGAKVGDTLRDLVQALLRPRAIWVMVPAGEPTERTVQDLAALMEAGDAIIDGGNTYFKDDVRRAASLAGRGIDYLDVGTSGGVWGLERGYCLMIGGPAATVRRLGPIFRSLAPGRAAAPVTPGREDGKSSADEGYYHCGPSGSGHFVKMVHNGIEYGLMEAYAEGFQILKSASSENVPAEYRFDLRLGEIAELWRRGSVVGSWLLDLTAAALASSPELSEFTGAVDDSGEGRWTVMTAVEEAVPAPVLAASLYARFRSRAEHTFGEKLLSAMRREFGGHREWGK